MNILDLRRVVPIYPSNQSLLDLRKNKDNSNNNKQKDKSNDFQSILQNEIDKLS